MIRKMRGMFSVLLLSVLVACASTPPKPTESEYLRTSVGAFEVSRETRGVRYILELDVLKEIEAPLKIKVYYENPVSPEEPLVETIQLLPGQEQLSLRSEQLPGIRNGQTYSVRIVGEGPDGKELLSHIQRIKFTLPPGF